MNFKTFIDEYPNEFYEFLDKEKVLLAKTDPEYKKMLSDISIIKQNNSKIADLFENEIVELSKEDCKDLQRVIDLQYQMLRKELRAIFLKGCKEIILYKQELDKITTQYNKEN